MPAVLRRLMRHAEIATTMKYYVTIDADAVADELWGRDWEAGNTLGNNRPKQAPTTQKRPPPNHRRKPLKIKTLQAEGTGMQISAKGRQTRTAFFPTKLDTLSIRLVPASV